MAGEQSKQLVELYAALQPNASLVTPLKSTCRRARSTTSSAVLK